MVALTDLFVHAYVRIDDAIRAGTLRIPPRPGPAPRCSDAEILTIAVVRVRLGRRVESAFLEEVRRDWAHYFPSLPHQSEFNRRVRWLWGAFEALRQTDLARVPEDPWQQVDTSALPVKHPSRRRGPDQWQGLNQLAAGFGWDAAHHEWFYGFRLAVRTDLGARLVRAWGIVPAAVDERRVADGLLDGATPAGLLLDRGFVGRGWAQQHAAAGSQVVVAHSRAERQRLTKAVRRPVAALRNRIETSLGEITDHMELARHGAKTFWGLLSRTAATLLAHTWLRLGFL